MKKILIADDDEQIVALLANRLKASGYEVIVAYDSLTAVKRAHEDNPDLLIVDIKMPAGGGMTVFEHLKLSSYTALTPVIFMTSHASEELRLKAAELGARGFLAKPFSPEVLLLLVKRVLGD
jgi:DNA-binding response OmpR family regulator